MIEAEDQENGETDDKDPRKVLDEWMAKQDEAVKTIISEAVAGLKSALTKERENAKEATRLEKELEAANKKLDAYKTDEEKDLEEGQAEVAKLTKERDEAAVASAEAIKALEDAHIGFAITLEALKQDLSDPEDARALLGNVDIKYDSKTGEVTGAEAAIKALVRDKPYLVAGHELGTPRKGRKKTRPTDSDDKPAAPTIRF